MYLLIDLIIYILFIFLSLSLSLSRSSAIPKVQYVVLFIYLALWRWMDYHPQLFNGLTYPLVII